MSATSEFGVALFECNLAIRWRDLDAYDHVNNSVFLTLLEEARIRWFATLPGAWRDAQAEPVLARSEMNYRMPIPYPAGVRVELGLQRIGRSSLGLAHRMSDSSSGALYADGNSVLVWVSPSDGRPIPLPASITSALPLLARE
jgi:acyl-CoA thioester hydrolase